jgi:hypothetical protein
LELAAKSEGAKDFYRDAVVKTLPDPAFPDVEITRASIRDAFQALGAQMRATDVFVFFIAGHGKTVGGDYYFLPASFKNIGLKPIQNQGFGPDDWEEWTAMVTAEKSLFVYDTCESGSLATGTHQIGSRGAEQIAAYERLKDRLGRMTLMATNDSTIALEGYRNKHGILTYAILEAIARADHDQDDQIALTELIAYVGNRVPEISCELTKPEPGSEGTCYQQVPQASFTGSSSLFPISPRYDAADPDPSAEQETALSTSGGIAESVPNKPTHFVAQPVKLLDAEGQVLRQLPYGFWVTKVKTENDLMLIARDGKIIGYVEEGKLAELK